MLIERYCRVLVIQIAFSLFAAQALSQGCELLAPTNAQNIDEEFKGEIEGQVNGIVGKIIGGRGNISGEYRNLTQDTLSGYPESHKLYVWQRIIYLACLKPDSVDINNLLELYLSGPDGGDWEPASPQSSRPNPGVSEQTFNNISINLIKGHWSENNLIYIDLHFENSTENDVLFFSFPLTPGGQIVASNDDGLKYRYRRIVGIGLQECDINFNCRDTPASWTPLYPGISHRITVEAQAITETERSESINVSIAFLLKGPDQATKLWSTGFPEVPMN